MTEHYKSITVAELLNSILEDNYNDIYFQDVDKTLLKATDHEWKFSEFKRFTWFRLEVLTDGN